jgi:outer membrane receptor protein involved in Fe transport
MTRKLLLTFTLLLSGVWLMAQTTLEGVVKDQDLGDVVIGANVKVMKGATVVKGAATDLDGKFRISLDPGTYDVEVSFTGMQPKRVSGVAVLSKTANSMPAIMLTSGNVLADVIIEVYKVPLIKKDETSGGQVLTSDQIKNLPTRSVNQIVATTAGTSSIDGGDVNIKGTRSNGTNYYVDGMRVFGNTSVPVQDIEQIAVITSGLGAEYGDVTGGVISVITKGPADKYHGGIEGETSQYLDPFGYNLISGNISGPIIRRKSTKESILGFRLSGQYRSQKDDDPTALPIRVAKESVRQRLEAQPVERYFSSIINSGHFLTLDSMDVLKYRPNETQTDLNITGKLDLRISKAVDMSLTGFTSDTRDKFTPSAEGYADNTSNNWSDNNWTMLNSVNNPTLFSQRHRGIFRFRHRLGSSDGEDGEQKSGISNASYTIQASFERGANQQYDKRHEDRFFNYGHIGKFDFDYEPITRIIATSPNAPLNVVHLDYSENFAGFTPGTANPGLVAYNQFSDPENFSSYLFRNGRSTLDYTNLWGGRNGMHANVNQVFNRYRLNENDVLQASGTIDFDLKFGKKSGVHSIQIGLLNEQRTDRFYSLAPTGLWDLATQKANSHFNGLDTNIILYKVYSVITGDSTPIYANAVANQQDNKFYREVREKIGVKLYEYINVNGLDPSQMSLDLFSPLELTDQSLVNYYGFDYKGKKTASNIGFNDFFTSVDEDGVRNFPVAPFRPAYQAAYIKDKFAYKDLLFSVGLRVERFDLNTKVLRDPYSLYEIIGADEFVSTVKPDLVLPASIGSDFKVYTDGPGSKKILGYRDGEQWYNAQGIQSSGNQVLAGSTINPWLKDTIKGDDLLDLRFDPNTSFVDYEPQVNWMPRVAFSFPISDDANFFAHYDILVQRPPSGWQATPLNYLYFNIADRTPVNNPNLKPERVVDYEVGFQQKLTNKSAIKFSAYYREMRDMIQRRTVLYVPVVANYDAYANVDFGTTKGFTMQYDLRRSGNVEFRMAYTLQFADGTGSDADSQRGLTSRGNIRYLSPLTYDERHNINTIIDYRYGSGKQYNGPVVAGKDILANFGANLSFVTVSGRPFSSAIAPIIHGADGFLGSINGSRMPWRTNLDLRLDKSIDLSKASSRDLSMNVYLRVSNILNKKNVVGVYRFTGAPDDDGFLASQQGQSVLSGIQSQFNSTDAYLAAYQTALLNPNNYTQPRRIVLGVNFGF